MIAIILAGGSGTRFWPLSRKARPKQLVRLWGERVMLGETLDRLADEIPAHKVFVVCGPHLEEGIRQAVPELPAENIIIEPSPCNTAPAIALATLHAQQRFGDEVVGVFPSDHFIGSTEDFLQTARIAGEQAEAGGIITIGIEPTSPETGYGYIRRADDDQAEGVWEVDAFVEKPDRATALEYLSSGRYFWNAGMFFFKPTVLLEEIGRQMPGLHAGCGVMRGALAEAASAEVYERALTEMFERAEATSIDYGVMEGAELVRVVRARFAWSDVGHWAALPAVSQVDERGNVIRARAVLHDVDESIVYSTSEERVIAVAGMSGVVVVDTDDAVLVIPRDRAQDVRAIVAQLEPEQK